MPGRAASYMGLGAGFTGAKFISTASTVYNVTLDDQGSLLLVGGDGWSSAARLKFPKPEAGMRFDVFFIGDTVSSPTKLCSTGDDYDIYVTPDTTGQCVVLASTQEGGNMVSFFGINDNRYVAWGFGSSAACAIAAGST